MQCIQLINKTKLADNNPSFGFGVYIQYEDGKKLSFIDKALLSREAYFLINELVRQT